MQILLIFMAFLAGACLAIQAGINSNLAATLSSKPILAAFVSFLVGTIALFIIAKFSNQLNLGELKTLSLNEWWKLLGGFLGAFAVFTTILIAPKLGVVLMFLFVIFGQISTSLMMDFIGAFGLEKREISLNKILGLLIVGLGIFIYIYKDLPIFKG